MQKYHAILYYVTVFSPNILFIPQWLCVCVWEVGTVAYSSGGFCPKGGFVQGACISGAYSLGGFSPKGFFVQGAYISGGL